MSTHRFRILRFAIAPATIAIALALTPGASARVNVGVSIALPPGVHVSVDNYEPYYVGRVYYEPLQRWRPVYSFPVDGPYGVVYQPYVYDAGRVVCHDYIPGHDAGYGQIIVDGRGHYDPRWHRGNGQYRAYNRYERHDRNKYAQRWDRDRGHDRGNKWARDDRSGSGKHGKKNKKHKH